MGKAKKSKKHGVRYNPLARGDAMAVDSQPEMKQQKRKVSGDKFELKKQKKTLAASIRNLTTQANDKTLITRKAEPPAPEPAPELPEGFAFDLPQPTHGQALSMQTEAWR